MDKWLEFRRTYYPHQSRRSRDRDPETRRKLWDWEKAVQRFKETDPERPIDDNRMRFGRSYDISYPEGSFGSYKLKFGKNYKVQIIHGIGSGMLERDKNIGNFHAKLPHIVFKLLTSRAKADALILQDQITRYTSTITPSPDAFGSNSYYFFKAPQQLWGTSGFLRAHRSPGKEGLFFFPDIHQYLYLPQPVEKVDLRNPRFAVLGLSVRYMCPEFYKIPKQSLQVQLKGHQLSMDDEAAIKIAKSILKNGATVTIVAEKKDQIFDDPENVNYVVKCLELEDMLSVFTKDSSSDGSITDSS